MNKGIGSVWQSFLWMLTARQQPVPPSDELPMVREKSP